MNSLKNLAFLALVSPALVHAQIFDGFYGSLAVGIIQGQEKLNHDIEASVPIPRGPLFNLDITTANGAKLSDTSVLGSVSVGYAFLMNACFTLGLEGRGTFQRLKIDHQQDMSISIINANADFDAALTLDSEYAILAKLGWITLKNTQLYGLVGPQWGIFRFDSSFVGDINPLGIPATNIPASIGANRHQSKCGYLLGLGMEQRVTCNSSIGLEYNYANYGTLSTPAEVAVTVSNAFGTVNAVYHNSARMQTNAFLLKYNYYLG